MKPAAVLSFVSLAAAAALDKRTCSGNNCNRAVTGTREGLLPLASRSADCRSFLLTTVTPLPTTTTITVDYADGTSIYERDLAARQVTVTPSSIPQYAAVCSSSVAYASACLCFGLTPSVTTAPTPTVTVTATLEYCAPATET